MEARLRAVLRWPPQGRRYRRRLPAYPTIQAGLEPRLQAAEEGGSSAATAENLLARCKPVAYTTDEYTPSLLWYVYTRE